MTISADALVAVGLRAGLDAVGVCDASPFEASSSALHQRKRDGLHGGMQFTYRNPDRSADPSRTLPGATALVVGALDFHREAPPEPVGGGPHGRVASYHWVDNYRPLRAGLEEVAEFLRAGGHRAVVSSDENSLVDRAAAHRAGIGWWGKSTNILVRGAGSMVVLGSVITDAPVETAAPEPVSDGCGPCRRCLDDCPTGALVAPGVLDARRCLAWLVQADGVFDPDFRVALGDRLYGCDDCQDACPPNRVRLRRPPRPGREPTGGASAGEGPVGGAPAVESSAGGERAGARPVASDPEIKAWVPLLEVLAADDRELMERYGRWYIPRRQPRYLRRNALVVLANVGDGADPRVRAAVDRALDDADPLIRAHAVWCARRLGLGLEALRGADDPMVAAELRRAVPLRKPADRSAALRPSGSSGTASLSGTASSASPPAGRQAASESPSTTSRQNPSTGSQKMSSSPVAQTSGR